MALYNEIIHSNTTSGKGLDIKDFKSSTAVRWCPGCGNFSILAALQKAMSEMDIPKENFAIVSGIGCSSRFPYYMDTFGFHTIHGRAIAIASGMRLARPDLSIWVPTGDGDCLSIGGNHFIHACRRNMNLNILMFNNEIYSLTKGQQSPTSRLGQKTKSSPLGTIDDPFEPATLALGAGATFVARGIDADPKSMKELFKAAHNHQGTSFVEIYTNCIIFNDGALKPFTDKASRNDMTIWLEHNQPLLFGANKQKGIKMEGVRPKVISLEDGKHSIDEVLVHNNEDSYMAFLLANMSYDPLMPRPMGIFLDLKIDTYIQRSEKQLAQYYDPNADLMLLLKGDESWEI
jgi:2-oxoglutarate ferredoxin oxidoreductase subunit beta